MVLTLQSRIKENLDNEVNKLIEAGWNVVGFSAVVRPIANTELQPVAFPYLFFAMMQKPRAGVQDAS